MNTIGVILMAFGGADSMESVEPFIKNVLKNRPVSPEFIEKAKERYLKIGGASPLLDITKAQADALEKALNKEGKNYKIFVGMLNWHPFIKDTLIEMKDADIKNAIAIIMAPHQSKASTGGYAMAVEEALKTIDNAPSVEFADNWHTHPLYIEALVENIKSAIKDFPKKDIFTVFSAHSLPVSVLIGDPYVTKLNETISEIIKVLPLSNDYCLAFQSKGHRGEWLGPQVEEVIKEAFDMGKKALVIVPLGFVADHVETLYDIDIVFKETAENLGLKFIRVKSLNTSEKFIAMLCDVARRRKKTS